MIFRKHLPRQLEINKFLESLRRNVIHDYDIPISINELSAEYEKYPFFMDILYVPTILYQYHDSLLAGHQGVTRMYLTLKEKVYANNLFNSIRKYVQIVILVIQDLLREPGYKAYHSRIPYDFRPMSRISADIK